MSKFVEAVGDDQWPDYENDTYAISINLAATQHSMLHLPILDEPEDAVLEVARDPCEQLECRAFDTTQGSF